MYILGFQYDIAWQNKSANYLRVRSLVEAAASEPGSLLVLPEMFATGFSMDIDIVAEGENGATSDFLASLALQRGSYIAGGLVSRADADLGSNDAVVFGPGGHLIGKYRKMHPFSLGGEDKHYAAGQDPIVFDWNGVKVCPLICYDLRFPEIFRTAVLRGTEVFVVIANWPRARQRHWEILLKARAVENQAYVVGVNRVGRDPNLKYVGGSLIVDPHGEVIADGADREEVIRAEIDRDDLRDYRRRFPALRDMNRAFVHP
jgi:omega-amidase